MRDSEQVNFSRVLVVAQSAPWPPRGGGDLRTANTLAALIGAGVHTGLVGLTPPRSDVRGPPGLDTWFPDGVDETTEDPAAALAWIRAPDGHPSDRWWTPGAKHAVERAIDALDPEVVILEHLWTRRALDLEACSTRRTILCSQNVEGPLHEALALAADRRVPAALAALMARRTSEIEASTVARVDQIWACSTADAEGFRAHYRECAPVEVIPNAIEPGTLRGNVPPSGQPLLLFIGSFGYPPNVDAALWLACELLPSLHAAGVPARLRLIGADAPESLRRLAADGSVEVTGFVDDLRPHLEEAAVIPVPIFAGGGTRYKVLEAFGSGIPVVSTAKGIEGIDATPGEDYLLAEDVEEFTAAIRRLSSDAALRSALTRSARALLERRYTTAAMHAMVVAALAELGRMARPR